MAYVWAQSYKLIAFNFVQFLLFCHQIGYLLYCKMKGFNSFHLWACPPQRKVDYILYCHPKEQKVMTRDLLRNWWVLCENLTCLRSTWPRFNMLRFIFGRYQDLIHKAEVANIVVGSTNFYDKYFTANGGKKKINVVPEKLPYFAGDFWPIKVRQILRDNESAMKDKAKEFVSNSTMKEVRSSTVFLYTHIYTCMHACMYFISVYWINYTLYIHPKMGSLTHSPPENSHITYWFDFPLNPLPLKILTCPYMYLGHSVGRNV